MQRNWIGRSRRRRDPVPDPGARRGRRRLHDAARHAVRRDVLRARSGAPARRAAARALAERRRAARLRRASRRQARRGAGRGGGEDGRLHGLLRDEPGERCADPDLGRRLRADGLRHRRDHGGAGARRARRRVRRAVRPAGRPGDRRRRPRSSTRRSSTDGRPRRQSARSSTGSASAARQDRDQLPSARLGLLAPALLGLPDPDHLLRRARRRTRARGRAAGRAARHRGLQAEGNRAARGRRGVGARAVPDVRQGGPARGRDDGHLRRLVVVLPALLRPAQRATPVGPRARRLVEPGRPVHRRRRPRDDAPDLCALLHQGAERPRPRRLPRAVPAPVLERVGAARRHEDVEVEGQRDRARRHDRGVRRRRGAPLHPVHRPRARGHGLDRRRHRRDGALRPPRLPARRRGRGAGAARRSAGRRSDAQDARDDREVSPTTSAAGSRSTRRSPR